MIIASTVSERVHVCCGQPGTQMCFSAGRATQLKAGTNGIASIVCVCAHAKLTACTQRYALVQLATTHSWD